MKLLFYLRLLKGSDNLLKPSKMYELADCMAVVALFATHSSLLNLSELLKDKVTL